jgi:hypothetical protein
LTFGQRGRGIKATIDYSTRKGEKVRRIRIKNKKMVAIKLKILNKKQWGKRKSF